MQKEYLVILVASAQKGDKNAMNTLFNAYYNDVYYFALKTVKDEDLAYDITQEVFVEIIKNLRDLKEPAAFVTWMKQITYHQCTRYFKKKKEVLVESDEDGNTLFDTLEEEREEFIPEAAIDTEAFRKIIIDLVHSLPEEQAAALVMYYFDEMSVREIAEVQYASETTVKARLFHGRKAMKAAVEKYEHDHDIKLHSIAILPLFRWCIEGSFAKVMPLQAAQTMAGSITQATGVSLAVEFTTHTVAAQAAGVSAVASGAASAGTTSAATAATAAMTPLAVKITAVSMAALITVGGSTFVARELMEEDTSNNEIIAENISADMAEDFLAEVPESVSRDDIYIDNSEFNFALHLDGFVPDDNNTLQMTTGEWRQILEGLLNENTDMLYSSNDSLLQVNPNGWLFACNPGVAYIAYVSGFNEHIRLFRVEITE